MRAWQCTACGAIYDPDDVEALHKWRGCFNERGELVSEAQHHHDYPVGHVPAKLVEL